MAVNRLQTMPTVTSADDPIRVDWIVDETQRSFGVTFCPGKNAPGVTGVMWKRDLERDLRVLEHIGVDVLAPLIPEAEMRMLGVPNLLEEIRYAFMDVEWFPFPDGGVPNDMNTFAAFIDRLIARLDEGERVVVHCRGGLGRAGLTAACLLIREGRFQNAASAIAEVRRKRSPRAVETLGQERFVAAYAKHILRGGR